MLGTLLLVLFTVFFLSVYLWQQKLNNYWKRHNVKFIKPVPILGNMKEMVTMKANLGCQIWSLYNAPGVEDEPVVGIYGICRPAVLIRDPELVKRVMIKDFNSFSDRFLKSDPHHDPLGSNNMFFIRNPEWKELRTKLSPVFTSGKIKNFYPLMQEVGRDLEVFLEAMPNHTIVELKSLCARVTTDLIATEAFGIKSNSINNPKSEFYLQCRKVFELTFGRFIAWIVFLLIPNLAGVLRLKLFTDHTEKFLRSNVKYIMEERERTGYVRNDLIDQLIDLKRKSAKEADNSKLSGFDYLVAQAAVFQSAGFDTSSSTMSFILYEMAQHPEMQARLRQEIKDAFEAGNGEISYNAIYEMTYLSQVVDETLRKYPILAFLERECTPEKGSQGYSLEPYSKFVIPAGMPIYISVMGLQRDEKYWPEPERFDPERFSPENRTQLSKDAYMPFGVGPHNCIGMRVGLLQSKMGIIYMLKNHKVVTCDKTLKRLDFDPKTLNLTTSGGIYLRFEKD